MLLKHFDEVSITFQIADTQFAALNLVCEQFERSIPNHSHGYGSYEIHYIPRGYGYVVMNGMTYPISPATLFVTGPFVEHAQSPVPLDPMIEYCIYLKLLKKRRLSYGASPSTEEKAILSTFENTPFWFGNIRDAEDTWETGHLFTRLFDEMNGRRAGYQLAAEAILKQIVVTLARYYETGGKPEPGTNAFLSDNTSILIEEAFLYQYATLTIEGLAERLGLSVRQTQRILKERYGKTFLQKKSEARMSAAVILLSDTKESIASIAEELGYSSTEHFSHAFRQYCGVSPTEYRDRKRNYHNFPDNNGSGSTKRS